MTHMCLLIDQNVDDAVGRFFMSRGHEVSLVRKLLGSRAVDPLIAITAADQGLVVVSHDKDYRKFSQMISITAKGKFRLGAGRISLAVREFEAVATLEKYAEEIEGLFDRAQRREERLLIRLTNNYITRHEEIAPIELLREEK